MSLLYKMLSFLKSQEHVSQHTYSTCVEMSYDFENVWPDRQKRQEFPTFWLLILQTEKREEHEVVPSHLISKKFEELIDRSRRSSGGGA